MWELWILHVYKVNSHYQILVLICKWVGPCVCQADSHLGPFVPARYFGVNIFLITGVYWRHVETFKTADLLIIAIGTQVHWISTNDEIMVRNMIYLMYTQRTYGGSSVPIEQWLWRRGLGKFDILKPLTREEENRKTSSLQRALVFRSVSRLLICPPRYYKIS